MRNKKWNKMREINQLILHPNHLKNKIFQVKKMKNYYNHKVIIRVIKFLTSQNKFKKYQMKISHNNLIL